MKRIAERRVEKVKEDLRKFKKYFYTPLFKAKLISELHQLKTKKIKSPDEFNKTFQIALDKAEKKLESEESKDSKNFTVELFYKDFFTDMYFMDKKVFHTPLDESYSRSKHFLDIFSFRFRYHFFVVGVVSLAFSIITHLLLK